MLVLPLFAIVANWARLEIVRAVNEATGPTRVDLYSVPQVVKFLEVGLSESRFFSKILDLTWQILV